MNKSKQSWTGQDLHNLLTIGIEQLTKLYPNQSIENLKRRKQEARKKLGDTVENLGNPEDREDKQDLTAFEELLKRSGIEPNDVAEINRLNIYQTSKKGDDGEWDTVDNHAMQFKPKRS